jgi:transcriptional regulator with XRE-family HTH domain
LGQRIHQLREEAGLTLAALAARAEISTSYLGDIEHERTMPSLERLQWIAEALGLNARQLLEGVRRFGEG